MIIIGGVRSSYHSLESKCYVLHVPMSFLLKELRLYHKDMGDMPKESHQNRDMRAYVMAESIPSTGRVQN